jgi:TatD DNase family protein
LSEFGEGAIDSHCHLDFKHFDKDREAVMSRAREAGVVMMINSGVDLATNRKSLELAKKHDFMRATLGLSPNSLEGLSNQDLQSQLDFIKENAGQAVGIGEVGLDHYRCKDEAARNHQVAVFQKVIDLAKSLDLPLVIHSRDAEQQALEMVKDLDKVVFHCYGGSMNTMKQAVDRGFYISLATVVCRSGPHQVLARNVPLDHLLVETDSPFLAPKRGRNEPMNVLESVRLIAKIKGLSPSEVASATTRNLKKIYSIP